MFDYGQVKETFPRSTELSMELMSVKDINSSSKFVSHVSMVVITDNHILQPDSFILAEKQLVYKNPWVH